MSDRLYLTGQSAAQIRENMASYGLTPAQQRVAWLYIHGFSHDEIGAALGIRPNTIKFHLTSIRDRLGYDDPYSISPVKLLRRLLSPLVMLPMWKDAA